MPFSHPSLTEIENTAITDITTSGVPGLSGLLRNAVLRVLAWALSGLTYSLYGFGDWIFRQCVPFTATDEYLTAWAGLIGIFQKEATPATGNATFTGTVGLPLPLGAALTRQDGTPYVTTAAGTVDATGHLTVPFVAAVFGAFTDADDQTPISIDDPVPGINSGGVMSGAAIGGTDQETTDEFRSRMLFKYAAPPQGGASADYVQWATEVPGCTRAWVQPLAQGPGSLTVFVMFDDQNAAEGGFPIGTDGCAAAETRGPTATGDQSRVAEFIYPLRPVTALVYVAAPVAMPVNIEIASLVPDTPDTRAAMIAAWGDLFLLTGEPGGIVSPSDLYGAALAVPGLRSFAIVSPAAVIDVPAGQLPVMGTLT